MSSITSALLKLLILPIVLTQQQSPNNSGGNESTRICSNNPPHNKYASSSPKVIDQVLNYLDEHKSSIQSKIFQSYADKDQKTTKASVNYLYEDFRSNLEWMARDGVPNPNNGDTPFKFYLGPDNCNNDGWQIGLINIAAFLSQSMTISIQNDTCDELNWERIIPQVGDTSGGVYPVSNACGMRGWEYQTGTFFSCPEEEFNCEVNKDMRIKAVDKSVFARTPPSLECYPRTNGRSYTGYFDPLKGMKVDVVVESTSGRTDVESCCWWGR
jgi:hypothetical protein